MTTLFRTILAAGLMFSSMAVFAGDEAKQPSPEEMAKMMEAWQKSATPGAEHAKLGKMAGEWTSSTKMWMAKGAEAQESKGTAKCEMTMGGRWLQTSDAFEMMGGMFTGHGIMGFDNITKMYIMFWVSDMGTEPTYCTGEASADGKTITYTGTCHEPWDGSAKTVKYVYSLMDDNKYVFTGFDLVGTPNEFKVLEMTYTRK